VARRKPTTNVPSGRPPPPPPPHPGNTVKIQRPQPEAKIEFLRPPQALGGCGEAEKQDFHRLLATPVTNYGASSRRELRRCLPRRSAAVSVKLVSESCRQIRLQTEVASQRARESITLEVCRAKAVIAGDESSARGCSYGSGPGRCVSMTGNERGAQKMCRRKPG